MLALSPCTLLKSRSLRASFSPLWTRHPGSAPGFDRATSAAARHGEGWAT